MKIHLIIIAILYCFPALSETIIKKNEHGTLELVGEGSYLFYQNNNAQSIRISASIRSTNFNFYDGSYLKLNATNGKITRYSKVTGLTELFIVDSPNATDWDVDPSILNLLEVYDKFENSPSSIPVVPPGECFDGNIAVPCNYSHFLDLDASAFSSSSSCAAEQNQFTNFGFNGYSTHDRCIRSSQRNTMLTAIGVMLACTVEPTKLGCVTAFGAYLTAIDNQSETSYQCNRSYEQARLALEECQQNIDDGGDDSDVGDDSSDGGGTGDTGSIGTGSGSNSGGSSFCTQKTYHSVCTGGGCTTWTEITVVQC
ncbi:hypothetical protein [Thalassotalea fusca]